MSARHYNRSRFAEAVWQYERRIHPTTGKGSVVSSEEGIHDQNALVCKSVVVKETSRNSDEAKKADNGEFTDLITFARS